MSRTLNSVIDGDITAAPEDILRDISRIVSLEIGTKNDNVYEYVCPSWAFNDKNPMVWPQSCAKNVPSRLNPINSKLYVSPRCLYGYNTARTAPSLKTDRTTRREGDNETRKNSGLARKKPCETESKYSTVSMLDLGSSSVAFFKKEDFLDSCCYVLIDIHASVYNCTVWRNIVPVAGVQRRRVIHRGSVERERLESSLSRSGFRRGF